MAEKLDINNEEQLFKITDLNNCDTEWLENAQTVAIYLGKDCGPEYCKLERAYIAGRYENANIWHDLQKNPDDLPIEPDILKNEPENHRYEWFIVADVGRSMRALYSFAKEKWFVDYEEMIIGTCYFEPRAWCDFPQFER